MSNSTVIAAPDQVAPIVLTPESRERLDAAALRILRCRYKYVRPVEASDLD
jgi:hypothetical protein